MYSLSFSLTFPVLVNATNTSVYSTFINIAQHIYCHLLQSRRVNRNTRLQEFQDQCFAISLVTRTFCERSVEEFDSVKHSHFHIEMHCNCEGVSTFSSRKKGELEWYWPAFGIPLTYALCPWNGTQKRLHIFLRKYANAPLGMVRQDSAEDTLLQDFCWKNV